MVPKKGMLAFFFFFFLGGVGPPLRLNAFNLTRQKSLFADGFFDVVGRNILVPTKVMLTPLSCRSITSWLLYVETVIVQAQHYDVIDGVINT